jgi:alpha-tubulin suppressor-like RCC1 family protein
MVCFVFLFLKIRFPFIVVQQSRSKSSIARPTRLMNTTRRTIRRQTTYLSIPSIKNGNSKGGQALAVGENGMTQLGLKSSIDQRKNPQPVLIPEPIVQIAAGPLHSVCLTDQNNIYTFGCNDEHALGRPDNNDDDDDDDTDPFGEVDLSKVMNIDEESIVQIVAGDSHTLILSNIGKVYGRFYRYYCL